MVSGKDKCGGGQGFHKSLKETKNQRWAVVSGLPPTHKRGGPVVARKIQLTTLS